MHKYGEFEGEVVTWWLRHPSKDRNMKLLCDFTYIDPDGKRWKAEEGAKINGASIPSWAWGKTLGAPFVGDYRRASVVHDVFCYSEEPYKTVHKMFYYAMRRDGVKKRKALIMYFAVACFGPTWEANGKAIKETRKLSPSVVEQIASSVDLTLEQLEGSSDLEAIEPVFVETWNKPLQDGDELYL